MPTLIKSCVKVSNIIIVQDSNSFFFPDKRCIGYSSVFA